VPESATIRVIGAFEFHGLSEKQENFSWYMLQQAIINSPEYCGAAQCVIFTDSDLGNHATYNDRTQPYLGSTMLSPGFTLAYASDEGRSIGNHMVRLCDSWANAYMADLNKDSEMFNAIPKVDGLPFSHLRLIANSKSGDEGKKWFRLGPINFHQLLQSKQGG
jgi:hypothetical protein